MDSCSICALAIAPRHAVSLEGVEVDPEDAFLLGPLTTALPPSAPASAAHVTTYHTPGVNGAAAGSSQAGLGPGMPARTTQADVSWLRRTEYLAQDAQRDLKSREMGPEKLQVDTSREAEVARIEAAFDKVQRQPLSQIQHPTKPHLKAVKSWDLLPDVDTWSTQYQVVRFVDWPGRSKVSLPSYFAVLILVRLADRSCFPRTAKRYRIHACPQQSFGL